MADGPHVGLVGCGGWGRLILRDLKKLGAHVSVVAREKGSRANAVEHGADRIVDSVEALPAIVGAVVATPSDSHGSVLLELLTRNIPLFVEKPLTSDLSSARILAEAGSGRIFVMDKWRYHAGVERMAGYVRSGELGKVFGLRLFRLGWSMTHNEVDPIWNLLPHDLSICFHILNDIPPVDAAFADGLGPAGGGVLAILERREGPRVIIECSAHHPVNRRSTILACENGTVTLNASLDDHLTLRRGKPSDLHAEEQIVPIENGMPLEAELSAFLRHLDGGPPPMSSVEVGALVVERVCEIRTRAGLPA